MTRKNSSLKSSGKQQYSIGSVVVMALLVLAYWALTGRLPSSEEVGSTTPSAPTVAVTEIAVAALTNTATVAESAPPTVVVTPTVAPPAAAAAPATATVTIAPPTATPTAVPATATPQPNPTATTPPKPKATPTNPPRAGPAGMPIIRYDALPREAIETLILIGEGGPFPFDRDGITFQNREGLLPNEPRGYYSEYTVITPGSRDRGARRIIAGEGGEFYYTDDHYASFFWIELPQ
jgi:ribonuclease T1